mmetsp:Transcript_58819/g.108644  ORF Transcript_58819/g.108644 Transcript_58819/m.108644 type:complete len:147 (+) Transcript_58819:35-475(+)
MSFLTYAKAAVTDLHAFKEVRVEVEDELKMGGNRLSERQRELTDRRGTDIVPIIGGTIGGCAGVELVRRMGILAKYNRLFLLAPAVPAYIWPYQVLFYAREAQYLVEMMREEKTNKFARRLRKIFEASASQGSTVLEDLAGDDIED